MVTIPDVYFLGFRITIAERDVCFDHQKNIVIFHFRDITVTTGQNEISVS